MPVPTDITAGTISISGTTVTGVGTGFAASDIRQGDLFIWIEGGDGFWSPIVASVESNTSLTLEEPWEGPAISGARYRLRYQWDSSRVSAQSRQLIDTLGNGNVLALAGLEGPGVPVFDGPHSMVVRPTQDFVNGVAYSVQVDTLADRAAYDGQSAGFAVLVSDVGDGRSALFSKASNTSGDWGDPAYITGPAGPTGDAGPPGVVPRGAYNAGTLYAVDDIVSFNGSSFRKITTAGAGTAPSGAVPPVDNADWQVFAARGVNGTGTGDFVGPNGGVLDGELIAFSGTTGKAGKGTGLLPQASTLDTATARLMRVGAFGLGATGVNLNPPGDNLNTLRTNGTYRCVGTTVGTPFGSSVGQVTHAGQSGDYATQFGLSSQTSAMYFRRLNNNVWSSWREVYHQDNLIGTVSQSSGVPTGAIIERGSNTNGDYVRFADGTQICAGYANSGSSSVTVTLPSSFINSDYNVLLGLNSTTTTTMIGPKFSNRTTTTFDFFVPYINSGNATVLIAIGAVTGFIAIGRWF